MQPGIPHTKGDPQIAHQVLGKADLDLIFAFQDRGTHDLKGVPGEWRLFALVS